MLSMLNILDAQKIIDEVNAAGTSYHKLTFPNGTILNGVWDMSKYLKFYKIPDNLSGKTVLDVGPASGYFSFLFSKMGAKKVVALDFKQTKLLKAANELMNTNVEFVEKNIYDLDENFGKFDIVFCSNVLFHLTDIFTALKRLKSVTKNLSIICTSVIKIPNLMNFPVALFVGKENPNIGSYWRPTPKCFVEMMKGAGFNKVEEISTFMAYSEDGKIKVFEGVIHGYV